MDIILDEYVMTVVRKIQHYVIHNTLCIQSKYVHIRSLLTDVIHNQQKRYPNRRRGLIAYQLYTWQHVNSLSEPFECLLTMLALSSFVLAQQVRHEVTYIFTLSDTKYSYQQIQTMIKSCHKICTDVLNTLVNNVSVRVANVVRNITQLIDLLTQATASMNIMSGSMLQAMQANAHCMYHNACQSVCVLVKTFCEEEGAGGTDYPWSRLTLKSDESDDELTLSQMSQIWYYCLQYVLYESMYESTMELCGDREEMMVPVDMYALTFFRLQRAIGLYIDALMQPLTVGRLQQAKLGISVSALLEEVMTVLHQALQGQSPLLYHTWKPVSLLYHDLAMIGNRACLFSEQCVTYLNNRLSILPSLSSNSDLLTTFQHIYQAYRVTERLFHLQRCRLNDINSELQDTLLWVLPGKYMINMLTTQSTSSCVKVDTLISSFALILGKYNLYLMKCLKQSNTGSFHTYPLLTELYNLIFDKKEDVDCRDCHMLSLVVMECGIHMLSDKQPNLVTIHNMYELLTERYYTSSSATVDSHDDDSVLSTLQSLSKTLVRCILLSDLLRSKASYYDIITKIGDALERGKLLTILNKLDSMIAAITATDPLFDTVNVVTYYPLNCNLHYLINLIKWIEILINCELLCCDITSDTVCRFNQPITLDKAFLDGLKESLAWIKERALSVTCLYSVLHRTLNTLTSKDVSSWLSAEFPRSIVSPQLKADEERAMVAMHDVALEYSVEFQRLVKETVGTWTQEMGEIKIPDDNLFSLLTM